MQIRKFVGEARPEVLPQSVADHAAPRPLVSFEWPRKVVLFTPIKPPDYVARVARIALNYEHQCGEQFLAHEMTVVADNLLATGADPKAVNREVRKLEATIRSAMWNIVMNPEPRR